MKNQRNNFRNNFRDQKPTSKPCKCGGTLKMRTTKNYPHGKKSKAIQARFYKCASCGAKSGF